MLWLQATTARTSRVPQLLPTAAPTMQLAMSSSFCEVEFVTSRAVFFGSKFRSKPIENEARIEIKLDICCSHSRRNGRLKEEEKISGMLQLRSTLRSNAMQK
jgi:hypothetical protein